MNVVVVDHYVGVVAGVEKAVSPSLSPPNVKKYKKPERHRQTRQQNICEHDTPFLKKYS
jgi:hypothetical protein